MMRAIWHLKRPGALRLGLLLVACAGLFFAKAFSPERTLGQAFEELLSVDRLMRYAFVVRSQAPSALPVALVDMDDATYDAWGEPLITPRAKLQALISAAAQGKPAAIVVDVYLGFDDPRDANGQDSLRGYLQDYAGPPLIIATQTLKDAGGHPRGFKPTLYDDAIAKNSHVFRASALFNRDSDLMVRRWRLWETVCNGTPDSIASMQLLAAAAAWGGLQKAASLEKTLLLGAAKECETQNGAATLAAIRQALGSSVAEGRDGRMTYYFNRPREGQKAIASVRAPLLGAKGQWTPVLTVMSADDVLKDAVAPEFFDGRVALISGTHRETRDTHLTPFGVMPGAYVLANAVSSAGAAVSDNIIAGLPKAILSILIFVLFAGLFLSLRTFLAIVLSIAISVGFVAGAERLQGVTNAVDVVADAIAMLIIFQVLRYVFINLLDDMLTLRWRALFKNVTGTGSSAARLPASKS